MMNPKMASSVSISTCEAHLVLDQVGRFAHRNYPHLECGIKFYKCSTKTLLNRLGQLSSAFLIKKIVPSKRQTCFRIFRQVPKMNEKLSCLHIFFKVILAFKTSKNATCFRCICSSKDKWYR